MVKVVAVALLYRGMPVVAKRYDVGLWEFFGGKVEEGETQLVALARELREEVPELDVESLKFEHVGSTVGDGYVLDLFKAKVKKRHLNQIERNLQVHTEAKTVFLNDVPEEFGSMRQEKELLIRNLHRIRKDYAGKTASIILTDAEREKLASLQSSLGGESIPKIFRWWVASVELEGGILPWTPTSSHIRPSTGLEILTCDSEGVFEKIFYNCHNDLNKKTFWTYLPC